MSFPLGLPLLDHQHASVMEEAAYFITRIFELENEEMKRHFTSEITPKKVPERTNGKEYIR